MILLETLVVNALKSAGIKASTTESEEHPGDYVILARTGGVDELYGSDTTGWGGREQVDLDFMVYSKGPVEALELAYRVKRICRDLSLAHSVISNPLLDNPAQVGWFNDNQYGYTFGGSFTVLQNNTL